MTELATRPRQAAASYETDLYLWTIEQARLLRERRFAELDIQNLIDEVEGAGGSQKQELRSRLSALLARLLKWKYQPGARSSGGTGTINEQRARLDLVLTDSPSLRRYPAEVFDTCYLSGRQGFEGDRYRLHALSRGGALHRRAGARRRLSAEGTRPPGPVLTP